MSPYPKLIAFDTVFTIFWGWLDVSRIGKGPNARVLAVDNIERENVSEWVLRDRTNHNERWGMYGDVPKMIYDILRHDAKLAIVSRNQSKTACDRALWWWNATDPKDNKKKLIIPDGQFLFDDEAINNLVRVESYSHLMFIGFAGMHEDTGAARCGHAIAKYFASWIKQNAFGANTRTSVCELWARDRRKFLATNKIWVPEDDQRPGDSKFKIAWDQENRDAKVAEWGVKMPYIMFSCHFDMRGMPIAKTRWNEMVIYTHVQDALMLTIPLTKSTRRSRLEGGSSSLRSKYQIGTSRCQTQ
ncbi:hypothetical protein OG21DRAFT_1478302 [Imleria badia]|nr:hypothetical protein OG21DRAFT_1478302 [Imleria badia]